MPSKRPEHLGPTYGTPETDGGLEYDSAGFYLSSTDKHRNQEKVRAGDSTLRVPPFVWAMANKWVEDPRTPYRSTSDLLRDALFHRIHALEKMATDPPTAEWELATMRAELDRLGARSRGAIETITNIEQAIAEAREQRDSQLYQRTIEQAERMLAKLPEPYNYRLRSILDEEQKIRTLPSS